jgi:GNAT superfamily N-acetyltransferase
MTYAYLDHETMGQMAMNASLEIIVLEAASLIDTVHTDLCDVLIDAVSDGASVGWVSVPTLSEASVYWQLVASQVEAGTIVLLVAKSLEGVVGTVQLHLSTRPNGAHRGEVARLLVHTKRRRQGIGAKLMSAVEAEGWRRGSPRRSHDRCTQNRV